MASSALLDDAETLIIPNGSAAASSSTSAFPDHGWQKVSYTKRQRRPAPPSGPATDPRSKENNVFSSIELKAQERHRALAAAVVDAAARDNVVLARIRAAGGGEPFGSDDDDDSGEDGAAEKKEEGETKKRKEKKPKKPKVTVAEAASKIDAADLSAFLIDVTGSYEAQPDIQLMRFADYFGRAFSTVAASQFPWTKMFKESPVSKLVDVPLCHISESVYKTAADWLAQRPSESLGIFVLWSLDSILADLVQRPAPKGSKKPGQQASPKAQIAIFVVLAMVLRRKPDVLLTILPTLRDNNNYQGQEKLSIIAWVIGQASQSDPTVGLYAWARNLLPLIFVKATANPLTRDLVLQYVERILAYPKARTILINGATKKGERLLPPTSLEMLWRATFPVTSARVKATERLEALYPTLKEIALAGPSGSKAMKPVAQQLLSISIQAIKENSPELSKEATDIFIWCLTQNTDCFKQWEKTHLENAEATAVVLHKLADEWKEYSTKFSAELLTETLRNIRLKNEVALDEGVASEQASIKEANKYCKVILGRLSRRSKCMKAGALLLSVGIVSGAVIISPDVENWGLYKLFATFISQKSF